MACNRGPWRPIEMIRLWPGWSRMITAAERVLSMTPLLPTHMHSTVAFVRILSIATVTIELEANAKPGRRGCNTIFGQVYITLAPLVTFLSPAFVTLLITLLSFLGRIFGILLSRWQWQQMISDLCTLLQLHQHLI